MNVSNMASDGCHYRYRIWQCPDGTLQLNFKELRFQLDRKQFLHLAALCYQGWEQLRSKCPVRSALPCPGNFCLTECSSEPQTLHLTFGNLTIFLSRLEFSLLVKLCMRGESLLHDAKFHC
jgi:hypothetical protein